MTQTRRGIPLHIKILIGLFIGFATGWILQSQWGGQDEDLKSLSARMETYAVTTAEAATVHPELKSLADNLAALAVMTAEAATKNPDLKILADNLKTSSVMATEAATKHPDLKDLADSLESDAVWITYAGARQSNLKNLADNYAGPVGQIFLNMIFMVVVPLLFSALVLGVSSIGDARKVGRVGGLSLLMTLLLSGIAVIIGLVAVNTVRPGDGIGKEQQQELMARYGNATAAADAVKKAGESKSAADTIVDIVTPNPLKAAVDMNILGFMFFALVFGIALSLVEAEKALPVKLFLEGVFEVALQIIGFAMKIAPIAVFALGFKAAAILGLDALVALGKYAGLVLIALAFHQFVVYSLALKFIAKRDPLQFFRQIKTVMVTAFATSSSNATLPEALRAADKEVGLPKDISSFVLTVGATANQNGTALFEGITCLFLAQMYGVNLDFGGQMTVMFLAILAGVGTAGVPGGSWPYIAIILTKIGVPAEAIGICLGIDRILDMSRTVLNVSGDITIAACVTRLMGDKREPALEAAESS